MAHRLSRLHADRHLPACPLRAPPRGVRARRARRGVLRGYPAPGPRCGAARTRCGGISGWKNFTALLRGPATARPPGGVVDPRRPGGALGGFLRAHRTVVDLPGAVVLPWMTQWRCSTGCGHRRARWSRGEQGPTRDHAQRASVALARAWLVPYNTGWHLAHHVDMGIPWRNLPAFHAELERAGYATEALTYPSYRALWRSLASA